MISLYSGTVGGGKSYHATELALTWVRTGKHVIANFPIKIPDSKFFLFLYFLFPFIKRYYEKQLKNWIFEENITPEYLIAKTMEMGWMSKESQCLLLIDEAGVIFNSRDYAVDPKSRNKWIKFFSLSRKLGYDVVLIAQHDRMLDRQIRSLLEYDVKHLRANNSFFLRFLDIFRVTLFMYVYRWYGTKMKANLRFSFYSSLVANRYDTMRLFDMNELIDGIKRMYDGKVIPATLLAQIQLWEDELKERMSADSGDGDKGAPLQESVEAETLIYDTENVESFFKWGKINIFKKNKNKDREGDHIDYGDVGKW